MDTEERERIYGEFQEIRVEDQPVAFIVYSDYIYAVSEKKRYIGYYYRRSFSI